MPVYNVETYIEKAIESVLSQTYTNFELIIVDDGSTDCSCQICERYEKKENRITLIHKKNGGLSSARNCGLKFANGQYVLFIDSDDYWYNENVLDNIDSCILKNESDLVVFSYAKLYLNSNELVFCNLKKWDCALNCNSNELTKFMIQENIYKACAWNKCVRREIIDIYKMAFPEGYLNEDIVWCGELLKYCKKISYINNICYIYRQGRRGSITSSKSCKNISDRVDLIYKGLKSFADIKDKRNFILNYYAYEYCVSLGLAYFIKNEKTKKQLWKLKGLLKNDLNKKVHIVHILSNIFSFNIVRLLLCIFMKIKTRK